MDVTFPESWNLAQFRKEGLPIPPKFEEPIREPEAPESECESHASLSMPSSTYFSSPTNQDYYHL
ncbi:hypothetical protein GMDG_06504 [Pseudogymnoascus destructans 20631-21]|uniref:Uncharacterized protein n=1 Tax=Pseudogymnoascus destructans (strain ATCC MYA-4855 / 20631-21) TaxID=658429 RepID=L8FTW1_PSED2|nr:hypothetical protein GMDG_06504 [Pseudogymnoascus destructans 20631-21]